MAVENKDDDVELTKLKMTRSHLKYLQFVFRSLPKIEENRALRSYM